MVRSRKLLRLFSPDESRVGALRASGAKAPTRLSLVSSDDSRVAISFNSRSQAVQVNVDAGGMGHELQPVFIPTKEVLSLVRGMRHPDHDRATVEMIFDDGYIDLAELLARPGFEDEASSLAEDPRLSSIIRELVGLVGGRYLWTNGGAFRFEPGRYEERADPARSKSKTAQAYQDSTVTRFVPKGGQSLSSSMTAEGYRKIGVLHREFRQGRGLSLNIGRIQRNNLLHQHPHGPAIGCNVVYRKEHNVLRCCQAQQPNSQQWPCHEIKGPLGSHLRQFPRLRLYRLLGDPLPQLLELTLHPHSLSRDSDTHES